MENKTNDLARHGDLSFRKVNESIEFKGKTFKEFVLAHGENGHKHRLMVDEGAKLSIMERIEDSINKIYFKVEGGNARLVHEEHKEIVFTPGEIYVTIPEREYSYFDEQMKQVLD